ncbi:MAG: ABC transporter permease [Candidatus Saccharimonadales bacterium]
MQKMKQRYRYSVILLRELVRTDFKLRYQSSVLGYMWSLLRPLFLFLILYVVFGLFMKFGNGIPHYPVYLLLGIVLWNYFAEVTAGAVTAIVGKGDLLRKISFPKYVIILAGSSSALINLAINFFVIAVFMFINHIGLTINAFIIIPLVIELFILSLGLAFFLSALFVKFRDISYIWEVLLQGAFYATPILYPLSLIPHQFVKFLMLNPMAQIVQDARHVLITPASETIYQVFGGNVIIWFIPIGLTALIAALSAWYFRSQSKNFAEEV